MDITISDINKEVFAYMNSDEFKGAFPYELLANAYNQANYHIHRAVSWERFQFLTALAGYAKKVGGDAFRWTNLSWQTAYAGALKELEIFSSIAFQMKKKFYLFYRLFWAGHQMARRFLYKRGNAPAPMDVNQLFEAQADGKLKDTYGKDYTLLPRVETEWLCQDLESSMDLNLDLSDLQKVLSKKQEEHDRLLSCVVILGVPLELSPNHAGKNYKVYSDEDRAFALEMIIKLIGESRDKKQLLQELRKNPNLVYKVRPDFNFPEILVSQFNL
jgi:hypothetical protein